MTYPRYVSDKSLIATTGRSGTEWIAELDQAGAASWSHTEIQAHLQEKQGISWWWVGAIHRIYDRARGLNQVGRGKKKYHRCVVGRTIAVEPKTIWPLLAAREGLLSCLDAASTALLEPDTVFADGVLGTITITDVDDIGWVRLERKYRASCSIIHIGLRPWVNRSTKFEIAESRISDPSLRPLAQAQWSDLVNRLCERLLLSDFDES